VKTVRYNQTMGQPPHSATSERQGYAGMPAADLAAFDPEGDAGRRLLLNPHIFRLLGDVTGRAVLDAGCGQGYLCRLLAGRGAHVTGMEPAEVFFRYAVARERERGQGIRYLQATLGQVAGLDGQFDAVVSNVVLQDIPDWVPALRTCVRALRPGGLLVFSLEHPCFTGGTQSWREHGCVQVREYLREHPRPQRYGLAYHRPLSVYLNEVIAAGCVLTEVTEPAPPPGEEARAQLGPAAQHVPNFVIIAARRP
jgi:2-polyprenyl-3-methyl-5-hydroxy-6-metoxy-1,4-benzoquinol methylase